MAECGGSVHHPQDESPTESLETCIHHALQTVVWHACDALQPDTSFEMLGNILREVAGAIAAINRVRIRDWETSIPKLPSHQADSLKRIIKFGVCVATRMLEFAKKDCHFEKHNLFISYPGEERQLYVPLLCQKLEEKDRSFRVFVDYDQLRAGETNDPPDTILRAVLLADQILCLATHRAVQKKWPMAELLCALARCAADSSRPSSYSHLIVDAMPGSGRLADLARLRLHARNWVDDLQNLIVLDKWPTIFKYDSSNALGHLDLLVKRIFTARDAEQRDTVMSTTACYADKEKGKVYKALFNLEQSFEDLKTEVEKKGEGVFAVRSSNRLLRLDSGKEKRLAAFVLNKEGEVKQEFWYFDEYFGIYYHVAEQDQKITAWQSLADLMEHVGAFSFCVGDHEPIVNVQMTKQSKQAQKQAKARHKLSAGQAPDGP